MFLILPIVCIASETNELFGERDRTWFENVEIWAKLNFIWIGEIKILFKL